MAPIRYASGILPIMSTSTSALDIGKRIRTARLEAGYDTADKLAARLPVSGQAVRKWERGSAMPTHENLSLVAELTGKPIGYFYGEAHADLASEVRRLRERLENLGIAPVGQQVLIPLVGHVTAGTGGIPIDHIEEYRHIPATFIPPGGEDTTFLLKAHGESMIGAGIQDGDLLLVCSSVAVHDGDIAVLEVEGEVMVKRIFRREKSLLVISENPTIAPFEVTEARLVGRVMKSIRDH